jgi:hypothetical protein
LLEDDRAFATMKEEFSSAGKSAIKKASERKIANAGLRRISAAIRRVDLSRIYAALITHLGCLAFESRGAFASQR